MTEQMAGENDTGFGRKRKWLCRWLERLYRCHNRRKRGKIDEDKKQRPQKIWSLLCNLKIVLPDITT